MRPFLRAALAAFACFASTIAVAQTAVPSAGGAGHFAALLPDRSVLVLGGADAGGAPTAAATLYAPDGAPTDVGPMREIRGYGTATQLRSGLVLIAGGENDAGPLSTIELFELAPPGQPGGGFRASRAALLQPRSAHEALLLDDGRVLIRAGYDAAGNPVTADEIYDPATDSIAPADPTLEYATVFTDRPDYWPGETVAVKGGRWHPGEDVLLLFDADPLTIAPRVLTLTADANGQLQGPNGEFLGSLLVTPDDLGKFFTLQAVGATSAVSAVTYFADAGSLDFVLNESSPKQGAAGQSVTFSFKVTNSGGNTVNSISAEFVSLPSGWSGTSWQPSFGLSSGSSATPTVTVQVPQLAMPGTYSVQVRATGSGNTTSGTVAFNIVLAKSGQAITFGALSPRNYGDADFALTATASSGLAVSYSATGSACTVSGSTVHVAAVGTCEITASQAGDATYAAATPVKQTLTVNKATQTITFNALAAKNYGDADFALTATASSGLAVSYSATGSACTVSGSTVHVAAVGTCEITASQAGDATYAAATPVKQTLDVRPARLVIKANDKTKTYGGTDPAFDATFTSFVNGDTVASLGAGFKCEAASPHVNAGTYAITCSGAVNGNYELAYDSGTLQVNPARLVIKANDKTKTYGGADPAFDATFTSFVNGDTVASLGAGFKCDAASPHVNAGTYAITCSGAVNGNYELAYDSGTLQVNPARLVIKANDKTKTYGGTDPAFDATFTSFVNGDTEASLGGAFKCEAATPHVNVGQYAITCSGAVNGNYELAYDSGTLKVNPARLVIKANDKTKTYGGADPAFDATFTSFVNGDTEASLGGAFKCEAATPHVNVGQYAISCSGAVNGNYELAYDSGTLQVNQARLVIKANDKTKTYGGADPAFDATFTSFVNGDTEASLGGAFKCEAATPHVNVGQYAISCSGAVNGNYELAYDSGTLQVNQARLVIKANDKTRTYGHGDVTVFDATFTTFVNGDTIDSLGAAFKCEPTAAYVNAGQYVIACSGAVNANYDIGYDSGTLKVNPARLVIKANDKAMTYGGTVPELDATFTSFVNGDTQASLGGAFKCQAASPHVNAGQYVISCSGAVNANYDIGYDSGTLKVNPARLVIKANDKAMTYGGTVPELDATFTSFVNGDTQGSLGSAFKCQAASPHVNAGQYVITCAGAVNANYDIGYDSGTLKVNPARLVIKANDKAMTYGATDPAFDATFTSFVNGDTKVSLGDAFKCEAASPHVNAGQYVISCSGAVNANYDIGYDSGTLKVNPARLVIKANDQTKTYGGADPTFDATFTSFVNGDTQTSLGGAFKCAPTTAYVDAGQYVLSCSGAVNANYDIGYDSGTLTVSQAPLRVVANDATMLLHGAVPSFTVAYDRFVNGDDATKLGGALSCTTTATSASDVGAYPIQCAGLTSNNYAITYVNGSLTVRYAAGLCAGEAGRTILQPIDAGGTSVWKQGRTVPAKFRVCDANGVSIGSPGVVVGFFNTQRIRGTISTVNELTVDATNKDLAFRWDPAAQQWIFNIDTKPLPADTTYVYVITLKDGSTISFQYGLKG